MSRVFGAVFLPLALMLSGCMTPLDRQWHEVNDRFRNANQVFTKFVRSYAAAADEMARKKHDLQRIHVERDWEHFISIHTQDGRLVSTDASGKIVPLSVKDLQDAIDARNTKLDKLTESKRSWTQMHVAFVNAVDKFAVSGELTGLTEAELIKAKESAQQFFDSLLSAIGGAVAAAGVAAGS